MRKIYLLIAVLFAIIYLNTITAYSFTGVLSSIVLFTIEAILVIGYSILLFLFLKEFLHKKINQKNTILSLSDAGSVAKNYTGSPKKWRSIAFINIFLISLGITTIVNAQSPQKFTTNGTWVCPAGVTSVTIECWGAGGGSGGVVASGSGSNQAGGGGGGGAFSQKTFAVTAGQSYTVTVGTGGTAGASTGTGGGMGNPSSVTGTGVSITALGGSGGGGAAASGAAGALGAGGVVGTGYDFVFAGGSGTVGVRNTSRAVGGAGGGGAGNNATGANGTAGSVTSNTASIGGNGGAGTPNVAPFTGGAGAGSTISTGSIAGVAGNAPGGGAAGALSSTAAEPGAIGGAGQVVLVYNQLTYRDSWVSMDLSGGGSSPLSWCAGETRNVTVTVQNIGTATWTDATPDINIGIKWNTNGTSWPDYNVRVDAGGLAPGASRTYTFPITASNNVLGVYTTPLAAGTNNITFDVVYEAISWFGNDGGGVGPGDAVFTSSPITINAVPVAVAGTDVIACNTSNAVNITAGSSATNQSSINWTSNGTGSFSNANSLTTATYSPSAADLAAGSVILTLTANGTGTCSPATSTKNLTFPVSPTVSAGTDVATCSNTGAINITSTASATNQASVLWSSSGTGSFSNGNSLTAATYTPSAADITAGSVTLTLKAFGNGTCAFVTSTKTLTITPAPTSAAGNVVPTCSSDGAVNITAGSGATNYSSTAWTSNGSGSFINGGSLTAATYTPSAADISAGSVILTLTANGNGTCLAATSTKTLTIPSPPVAVAGTDVSNCYTSGAINITAGSSASNQSSVVWSSSGTGSFSNANSLTLASYTPTAADISAGTITITLTAVGNGTCASTLSNKNLIITLAPTSTAGSNFSTCSIAGAINITSGSSASNYTSVNWTSSGTGIFSNANSLTAATYTPSAADISAGSVTLSLSAIGSCSTVTSTKTLSIPAAPAVNAGSAVGTCSNSSAVNITSGATASNQASLVWSTSGGGSFGSNGSLTATTYTPNAADISAGSVTLTLTANGNGTCAAVTSGKTLTISPAPSVNAGTAVGTCSNTGAVNITLGATASNQASLVWSGGGGTYSSNGSLTATTYSPVGADGTSITLTLRANGIGTCLAATATKTLTITPAPTVNAGTAVGTCSNSSAINITSGAAASNQASLVWSGGGGAYGSNGSLTATTYTPNAADISAGSVTLTLTANGNGTCVAATASKTLTISPAPSVNAGTAVATCSNAGAVNITLGATASNQASLVWSGGGGTYGSNGSLTATTYTPVVADGTSITLTLKANGIGTCAAVSATKTLTITPAPTSNAGSAVGTCSNSAAVNITSGATATNMSGIVWSSSGTGIFANATSLTLATYAPSASDIAAGSVSITLTATGNGTCTAAVSSKTLTITPAPSVNAGNAVATCSNTGSINITSGATASNQASLVWSGGGGTYSTNGSLTATTYTPNAADISAGSVTLSLKANGNGTCAAATATKILTITTAPSVGAGSNVGTCSNIGAVNITTGSSASNFGTLTWSTSNGNGTFANVNSLTTATYTPGAGETGVTRTMVLTATGNGTCLSATATKTLTITTAASVSAGTDIQTCSNTGSINITAGATAGNYAGLQWSTSGSGSGTRTTSLTMATYTPSSADITAGSVILTLTAMGNGTCASISDTKTVTITPAPTANAGADFATCSNTGAVNITTGSSATNFSTIAWSTSNGSGTFANNTSLTTATYTPSTGDAGFTRTLVLTVNGNGACASTTDTKSLTITKAPLVSAGTNVTVCSTSTGINVTTGSSASNQASVLWTSSGTGSFANATSISSAAYTPSAADISAGSVTLTLTALGSGTCASATSTKTLTLVAPPTSAAGTDIATCSNSGAVNITAGSSAGNYSSIVWSTNGSGPLTNTGSLTTATFAPNAADITAGSRTLTLTANGNSNCTAVTSTKTIVITSAPTAAAGTNVFTCSTAGAVNITAGSTATNFSNTAWTSSGTGTFVNANSLTTATYTPSSGDITAGSVTLTLTANGNGTCSLTTSAKTLFIPAPPTAAAGPDVFSCYSSGSINITAGSSASNNSSVLWTSSGTGTFANATSLTTATYTPSAADKSAGSVTITLTALGNGSCASISSAKNLTITLAPTVNAGSAIPTCSIDGEVNISNGATATNYSSVLWTSSGTGTFNNANSLTAATYTASAADISAGSVTLTLTVNGNGTCTPVAATKTLVIPSPPTATAGTDVFSCYTSGGINITTGSSATGYSTVSWSSSGTGTFANGNSLTAASYTPSAADISSGNLTITLTVFGNGTCASTTSTKNLVINLAPTATVGPDVYTCTTAAGPIDITPGSNATVYSSVTWTTNGSGTLANINSLTTATYTPSAADISAGSVTLTLTAIGSCTTVSSTKNFIIPVPPVVNAGTNVQTCSNSGAVNITAGSSASNQSSVVWTSSGTGTFANTNSLTVATYTPGAADISAGSVTLTLTANGNGTCSPVTSTKTLTITGAPTAAAGTDIATCSNSGTINITGGSSATNYSSIVWSTSNGTGTLANTNSLTTATYNPSSGDITAGNRTLVLTVNGNGTCASTTSTKKIIITLAPTATAGTAIGTCSNSGAVSITAGSSATNQSSTTWTSSGTGTFANANSLTAATYTPSTTDISAGSVTLTLTANGNGPCASATSTKILTITPAPTVNAGTGLSTCAAVGAVNIVTTASATNQASVQWSSSGTGTFTNATSLTAATYTPSAADISAGSVTLTLRAIGNGTCTAVTSTKTLTIVSIPVAPGTITGTQAVCPGTSASYSIIAVPAATTYTWSVPATWSISSGAGTTAISAIAGTYGQNGNISVTASNGCGTSSSISGLTINITPVAAPDNTGYTDGSAITDGPIIINNGNRGFLKFPLTFIPVGATISNTVLALTNNGTTATSVTTNIVTGLISNDPTSTPAGMLYNAIGTGTGTNYNSSAWPISGIISLTFVPTANLDIQGRVPGYIALGLQKGGTTRNYTLYGYNNGANTPTLTITYSAPRSLAVTVNPPAPSSAGTITGTISTCPGSTGLVYSIPAATYANATGYVWTVPTGWTITSGQTTTSITVTAGNATQSGSITVTASNSCGISPASSLTVTVNPTPVVSIVADYCNSAGVSLMANSSPAAASYLWSTTPAQTTQTIVVDEAGFYQVTATTAAGCSANASISVAQELVTNGDFSLGNTGFTTSYINNQAPYTTGTTGLYMEGYYAVGKYGNTYHPNFWGTDHTTGTGNFMLVNGSGAATPPVVWQESSIPVLPNTTYYFSAWAMSLNNASPYASLQFNVNGTLVGSVDNLSAGPTAAPTTPQSTTGPTANTWTRFYGQWNSGSNTTATVSVVDLSTVLGGNDFGLDDISFGTLSPFIKLTSAAGTDAQTVCSNTAITNITYSVGSGATGPVITGLPTGVTSSYNGVTLAITGAPTTAGTYKYFVSTTGTCAIITDSGTITVNAQTINLLSANNTQTPCVNTLISDITYSVGGTATGASVSGLPTGVTGSYNSVTGIFTITGTPNVAGIFNYTVTTSGPCAGVTATGTITVNSQTITLSSATASPSACINTTVTITYIIGGTATGAGVTGLPTGLNGTYNAGVFTITGQANQFGTFNYTVTTTGTCAQVTATGIITINPDATLILASGITNQTPCINVAITPIVYTIGGGATNVTVSGLPTGVTGVLSGTGFTISGIPTSAANVYNYTVITTGTCVQTSLGGTITVQPNATITLTAGTASQAICVNTAITPIAYTIGGGATNATVSGLPTGVTGTLSGNIFTISGTPTVSGSALTYTVTTTGTCVQTSASGTITVNANATIVLASAAATTAQSTCKNTAITPITYTIGGGATNAGVTGLPPGVTGALSGTTFTISGTPTSSAIYNYTVTTTGGCVQATATGSITVNQPSTLTGASQAAPICSNGNATINLTGLVANSTNNSISYSINGVAQTVVTGINADASGNASFNTVVLTTINNGQVLQVTGVGNGACAQSFALNVTLAVNAPGTWLGVNTNWFDNQNWCSGVPLISTDVIIPGGLSHYPLLTTGTATAHDITIQAGASVIVQSTLQLAGAITNSGIFDITAGSLELNGSSAQTIAGSIFVAHTLNNLTISNTSAGCVSLTAALNDTLNISNTLAFGNINNGKLTTNDNLTILSNATNTARVADVTNAGVNTNNTIAGKVNVERYIPARRAWRLLTAPISSSQTINSAWQEGVFNVDRTSPVNPHPGYGTDITNTTTAANGYDQGSTNNPSLEYYNGTGWAALSGTTNDILSYPGYMLFVRGDRSIVVAGTNVTPILTTLRTKGTLNIGTQNITFSNSFKVIGNPYASAINFNTVTKTGSIADRYYMWDSKSTGSLGVGLFVIMDGNDDGTNTYTATPDPSQSATDPHPIDKDGTIQSGSAVLVQFVGTDPSTLTIKESDKIAANDTYSYRPVNNPDTRSMFRTNLYSENADGSITLEDGILNEYSDKFSNNVDPIEDAFKITNFGENLYSYRDSIKLAIEKRQPITANDTIFLRFGQVALKTYKFEFVPTNLDQTGLQATLVDNYLNTRTPISLTDKTTASFGFDASIKPSYAADRFYVVFKPAGIVPVTFISVKATKQNAAIAVQWSVANQLNIKEYKVEKSTDGHTFTEVAMVQSTGNSMPASTYNWLDANAVTGNNIYRIEAIGNDGQIQYSDIVSVLITAGNPQIAVYPNPVQNGNLGLQISNMPKGKYNLRLITTLGQVLFVKSITYTSGSATVNIQLGNNLAKGTYHLEVTGPDESKTTLEVFN